MRDGVAPRGIMRRSRRRKEVADTMETAEEDAPGDARDAAQFYRSVQEMLSQWQGSQGRSRSYGWGISI